MEVVTNSLEEMAEEYHKLRKKGEMVTIKKVGWFKVKYILRTVIHPLAYAFHD